MVPTKEAKSLGKKFKDLRTARGIKLQFIADKLGLDASMISRFESGRRSLSTDHLKQYELLLA